MLDFGIDEADRLLGVLQLIHHLLERVHRKPVVGIEREHIALGRVRESSVSSHAGTAVDGHADHDHERVLLQLVEHFPRLRVAVGS